MGYYHFRFSLISCKQDGLTAGAASMDCINQLTSETSASELFHQRFAPGCEIGKKYFYWYIGKSLMKGFQNGLICLFIRSGSWDICI